MRRLVSLLAALFLFVGVGQAQVSVVRQSESSGYQSAAVYRYAEPGQLTMTVQALGSVRNPGMYQIPLRTTLVRLLALSGGPVSPGERRPQDTRIVSLRLVRPDAGGQPTVVLERQWVNEPVVLDTDLPLREGDIMTLDAEVQAGTTRREDMSYYMGFVGIGLTALGILISLLR